MHRELEQIFFSQRRARDGKQKHEKVLDITNQEMQIKTKVRNYFTQNGYVQKDKKQQLFVRKQREANPSTLLV